MYSVWSNPDSKIYNIVKYLLENSSANSRTWSIHLKYLSQLYGLRDPVECLKLDPPSKAQYKEDVQVKICAHYEKELDIGFLDLIYAFRRLKYILGASNRQNYAIFGE